MYPDDGAMRLVFIRALIVLCSVLLGCGLFAPCMVLVPGLGEFTELAKYFRPDLVIPREVSIAWGVWTLLGEGKLFVGILLLSFSILFPLWKLGVLWQATYLIDHREMTARRLTLVEKLGKYSMLDLLVIALIVLAVKGLPGGTQVQVGWGGVSFLLAALLSMGVSSMMSRRFRAATYEALD